MTTEIAEKITSTMTAIFRFLVPILVIHSCLSFSSSFSKKKNWTLLNMGLFDMLFGGSKFAEPCVMGDEDIMSKKAHGTSATPVQENLRWGSDRDTADRICNFNRHYAEYRGYWEKTSFIEDARKEYEEKGEVKFYDSNTGKLLFVAPKGRTFDEFIRESKGHGWPSFRDSEVVWDDVRCLKDGESVSLAGTHLGHNIPDSIGNRYCINLVSVAGSPKSDGEL